MEFERYAPPNAAVADAPPQTDAPPLWNPDAAACWSLLLTPIFGAWLHALNWDALGEPIRAQSARRWAIAAIIIVVAGSAIRILLPAIPSLERASQLGAIAFLFIWYFASAKAQVRWIKSRFAGDYVRRGWARPLLIGVAVLVVFSLISGVLAVATRVQHV